MQVYSLISSLNILLPGHWTVRVPFQLHGDSPTAIPVHLTYHTHCHLCPTRYSFTPESTEAREGKVSCPSPQHRNNVPIFRGEKYDMIYLYENPAPSGVRNRTVGSYIGKAPRSNHCATGKACAL